MRCSLLTLSCYLDDEVDAQRRGEVEAHLVGCPRCRSGLGHLREEAARVGGLARVHVSDTSTRALLEQLGLIEAGQPLPPRQSTPAADPVPALPWLMGGVGPVLPWVTPPRVPRAAIGPQTHGGGAALSVQGTPTSRSGASPGVPAVPFGIEVLVDEPVVRRPIPRPRADEASPAASPPRPASPAAPNQPAAAATVLGAQRSAANGAGPADAPGEEAGDATTDPAAAEHGADPAGEADPPAGWGAAPVEPVTPEEPALPDDWESVSADEVIAPPLLEEPTLPLAPDESWTAIEVAVPEPPAAEPDSPEGDTWSGHDPGGWLDARSGIEPEAAAEPGAEPEAAAAPGAEPEAAAAPTAAAAPGAEPAEPAAAAASPLRGDPDVAIHRPAPPPRVPLPLIDDGLDDAAAGAPTVETAANPEAMPGMQDMPIAAMAGPTPAPRPGLFERLRERMATRRAISGQVDDELVDGVEVVSGDGAPLRRGNLRADLARRRSEALRPGVDVAETAPPSWSRREPGLHDLLPPPARPSAAGPRPAPAPGLPAAGAAVTARLGAEPMPWPPPLVAPAARSSAATPAAPPAPFEDASTPRPEHGNWGRSGTIPPLRRTFLDGDDGAVAAAGSRGGGTSAPPARPLPSPSELREGRRLLVLYAAAVAVLLVVGLVSSRTSTPIPQATSTIGAGPAAASAAPSSAPSTAPSAQATAQPSAVATQQPSTAPSQQPSTAPSQAPPPSQTVPGGGAGYTVEGFRFGDHTTFYRVVVDLGGGNGTPPAVTVSNADATNVDVTISGTAAGGAAPVPPQGAWVTRVTLLSPQGGPSSVTYRLTLSRPGSGHAGFISGPLRLVIDIS